MNFSLMPAHLLLVSTFIVSACVTSASEPVEAVIPEAPSEPVLTPIPGPVVPLQIPEAPPQNVYETPLPDYSPGPVSRPAQRLLEKASEQWSLSKRDQALALLDRAFRIDNQSAEISLRHSEYYFEMGQFQKTENWAKRTLGNPQVTLEQTRRAWHIIARTRYRLGDQAGAQKALDEANRL